MQLFLWGFEGDDLSPRDYLQRLNEATEKGANLPVWGIGAEKVRQSFRA
jgi:hypothetical protein